jgi:hypothetical protein
MKRILFSLLPVIFLWPGSCRIATAQEPDPPGASSDEITFEDNEVIEDKSSNGKFPPVTLNPLETTDIKLQFSTALAGVPVIVQVLDGGELSGIDESATLAADGTASFQFQVSDQPGLYRILVLAGGAVSMVQFEVPNPPDEEE